MRLACVAVAVSLWCTSAQAQNAPAYRPGQIVLSAGAVFVGSQAAGEQTVTIRRNATGTPPPFTVLRAESRLASAPGLEARLAFALTPSVAVEAGGSYAKPQLGVTISQDDELVGSAFASEDVQQFTVDMSAIYQLPLALGRSAKPYVIGGGGYLRQLHEGRLLVETGYSMHVGGGVHYWFRAPRAGRRALGVRGEARYIRRSGGVDFEDRTRGLAAVSALAVVGF